MANDGTVKIGTELDEKGFESGLKKLGSVASTGLKATGALIAGVGTAAAGAVGGLLALESATEEYRIAQGKLNTAFETAGYSADTAKDVYRDFFGILGDVDTATEASQLLAKLSNSQQDLSTWTDIAAGVWGTFGDSLPVEGLIEASNETAKTGTVVGVLADALNWAGISEDEFNTKLAECSDESERNQLIMDTLSSTYDEASDSFYRNNAALIASREAQAQMDEALAKLGTAVSEVKSRVTADFLPAVSQITEGLAGMLAGTEGADQEFSDAIGGLIKTAVSKLPDFLEFGAQILSAILSGIIENLPSLVSSIPSVVSSIGSAFKESAPQMAEAGQELVSMLASGVTTGIPILLESIPQLISEALNFLSSNLPSFLQKGTEFVTSLIDGIFAGIPDFVASLPELITAFFNFIASNLPQIIATGTEISKSLGEGIIKAIPEIVKSLPAIILAIVQGLISLAGSLLEAGASLIQNLIQGIQNQAKNLVDIGSKAVSFVVDGLKSIGSAFIDIGRNMVEGIWKGISGAASWIADKLSNFAGGLVGTIANALGIHSPSTVFRDKIGKNIGLGVASGIEKSMPDAKSAMDKMSKDLVDAIPYAEMRISYANSAMSPSNASATQFSTENALSNAAGMLAMTHTASGNREVVFQVNGTEFARAIIPDIRSVESQSPAIKSD